MGRGGHRENAGRKSEWVSSSQTRPIRVPEWMADQVLDFARKLDNGETIDTVHNQKPLAHRSAAVQNLLSIVEDWDDRASGKETQPRWQFVSKLIKEVREAMQQL